MQEAHAERKRGSICPKEEEWAEKNASRYASVDTTPEQNHISTDEKVAAEVMNIPMVDTGTTPGSVARSTFSFQQYLEYQAYCEEIDFGFLNVHSGVDFVKVGRNLLGPA